MSNHPDPHYNKPDALSSAIARLELTAEIYVNGDFCGTWAVDTSGSRRTPFHLIASGTAWLHIDAEETKQLTAGDLVVFPNDKQHIIASNQHIPNDIKINSPDLAAIDNPTQMVCGFFDFANKASWPLLDSLAPVIILDLSETSHEIHARNLIKQMLYEFEDKEPGHHAVANQLAYLLFIEIIRHQIKAQQVKTGMLAALFDNLFLYGLWVF